MRNDELMDGIKTESQRFRMKSQCLESHWFQESRMNKECFVLITVPTSAAGGRIED